MTGGVSAAGAPLTLDMFKRGNEYCFSLTLPEGVEADYFFGMIYDPQNPDPPISYHSSKKPEIWLDFSQLDNGWNCYFAAYRKEGDKSIPVAVLKGNCLLLEKSRFLTLSPLTE